MSSDRKWIYLSFIVFTLLCAWVLNNAVILVLNTLSLPNPLVMGVVRASALASFGVMGVAASIYFRQENKLQKMLSVGKV